MMKQLYLTQYLAIGCVLYFKERELWVDFFKSDCAGYNWYVCLPFIGLLWLNIIHHPCKD